MSLLLFKVAVTPLLVVAATLLQRRFGGAVGGLFTGLPVTSAPLSVFLALQYGASFAARAAVATLLGLAAMAGFCAAYARMARSTRWLPALLVAAAASGVLFAVVSHVPQRPGLAAAVVFPVLLGVVLLIGRPLPAQATPNPWWDLPARSGFALGAVLAITAAASHLGPTWTGLLATLPVLSAIMGSFTHHIAGAEAARSLLRGIVVGALGAASFNLVVALSVQRTAVAWTYAAAALCALAAAAAGHAAFGAGWPTRLGWRAAARRWRED